MKIAITGGIGAGKSFVCKKLNDRGIRIYDCDAGAKKLMNHSVELRERLTSLIGPDTYVEGKLNKASVSQFLLASEENKQAINAIVHPAVIKDFYCSETDWMETAILYEAHLEQFVDAVVCVTAPEEIRISRIMQRDSITRQQAKEWIDNQMPQEEVASRADYVITNDGTCDITPQIEQLLETIEKAKR